LSVVALRAHEPIAPGLEAWLSKNFAKGANLEMLEIARPRGGFSAHTLLIKVSTDVGGQRSEHDWVVRLEQTGREIFPDTDVGRQVRMMRALAEHGIAVPVVLGFESDRSLLGGQFLVMERIFGHSLPQHPSYQVAGLLHDLAPDRRRAMWQEAITTIGRINRLDWRSGFAFLDKPAYGAPGLAQYLGWLGGWRQSAGGGQPHPVIDAAMRYLIAKKPPTRQVEVLWGDSNPGNILFDGDGSLLAAHDFEASALGPGEIDLGWWFFIDELLSAGAPRLAGLPDRATQIATYERALGRPVEALEYYEILAGVRICLVVVRSAQLLVREGRLPAASRAAFENPLIHLLGSKLGLDGRGSFEDYMELVTVMNRR
jgi:aminoglycoside phosphotransferase (APT) family kinase protein